MLNELAYPGWMLEICSERGDCRSAVVATGDGYLLISGQVQSGDRTMEFRYRTPGMAQGWIAFGLGLAVIVVATLATWLAGREVK